MRQLAVIEHLTLDGVMQGPGRPDEDTRGGFARGGWAIPDNDEVMGKVMAEGMGQGGSLLFGRRTYEDFYGYWPQQNDNPYTDVLNDVEKFVVSRTLTGPLPWSNSTLLKGEAAETVKELKEQPGLDIGVMGSGELVQSLIRHQLVDNYLLMIHPLILGSGRRLFPEGAFSTLHLVDSVTTTTGVLIATYRP